MPDKFEAASNRFEGFELRIEAEMIARRRRATRLEVAMLTVIRKLGVEKLKICKVGVLCNG